MKVRCIKLLNSLGQEVDPLHSSLSIGKVYYVMGIDILPDGAANYRLLTKFDKEELPSDMALYSTKCFEIISDVIPSNWAIKIHKMSLIEVCPSSWHQPGFLENFYDRDPSAYKKFEQERDLIMQEDP